MSTLKKYKQIFVKVFSIKDDKKIHICGYLKNFLFNPADIDRPISTLSGGERNRLLLAKNFSQA